MQFVEDGWSHLDIGGTRFRVLGPCVRCAQVGANAEDAELTRVNPQINVDQDTSSDRSRLFALLAKHRRKQVQCKGGSAVACVSDAPRRARLFSGCCLCTSQRLERLVLGSRCALETQSSRG